MYDQVAGPFLYWVPASPDPFVATGGTHVPSLLGGGGETKGEGRIGTAVPPEDFLQDFVESGP